MKIPKGWREIKKAALIMTGDKVLECGKWITSGIKTHHSIPAHHGTYIRRKSTKQKGTQ